MLAKSCQVAAFCTLQTARRLAKSSLGTSTRTEPQPPRPQSRRKTRSFDIGIAAIHGRGGRTDEYGVWEPGGSLDLSGLG